MSTNAAERCDIGDDARQLHALFEILHRAHAFGKGKGLEGASRVASGFFQFLHDVGERGQAELVRDIVGKADGLAAFGALHEFADGCARILGHALDHGVGFRVHGAGVEGLLAVPDAQEAGALLKGLGAEAGHLEKIPAGLEGAVFVAVSHDIAGERGAEAGNVGEELLAGPCSDPRPRR